MKKIASDLKRSIREEQIASMRYRARANYATKNGDRQTARLYLHIAHEEDIHAREFNSRLRNV